MAVAAVIFGFLFVLFCINYTLIAIILHFKNRKANKKKGWELDIENEIRRIERQYQD